MTSTCNAINIVLDFEIVAHVDCLAESSGGSWSIFWTGTTEEDGGDADWKQVLKAAW